MERMMAMCGGCAGIGHTVVYEPLDDISVKRKEITCDICNGKGYTEYAVFSIEEAEAILKHCGLSEG